MSRLNKLTATLRSLNDNKALSLYTALPVAALLALTPVAHAQDAASTTQMPHSVQLSSSDELSFSAALQAALANDPEIRVAQMTFTAEQEEVNIARSNLLPTINLAAGHRYEDSDNIYTDPDNASYYDPDLPRSSGTLNDFYWQVSLRQPLVDFARYYEYKGAESYVDAAAFRYKRAEQDLIYRLSERYLAVLLSAQQVYLNEQKLNALEANLEQVERELSLGVGDKLNVLEVKARRDLAKSDLLQAKSELNDSKTLLQNMISRDVVLPEAWVASGHLVEYNLPVEDEAYWLEKVNQNATLQESLSKAKQSEITVSARNAGHYPTVNLNLSYQDRDSEDDQRTREDLTVGIELSLPLYQGGRTEASIRQASARLNAEHATTEFTRSQVSQRVKLAYSRMISLSERLSALVESRQSGQGYLDAAIRGQALNLRSQVEVLDARTRLVDVQLNFANTLNQYLLANLSLHLETGLLDSNMLEEYDQLFAQAAKKSAL